MRFHRFLLIGAAAIVALTSAAVIWFMGRSPSKADMATAVPDTAPLPATKPDTTLRTDLKVILAFHGKNVRLFAEEKTQSEPDRQRASAVVGSALFHDKLARKAHTNDRLTAILAKLGADRFGALGAVLDYTESDRDLYFGANPRPCSTWLRFVPRLEGILLTFVPLHRRSVLQNMRHLSRNTTPARAHPSPRSD